MSEVTSYIGRNGRKLWKYDVRVTQPEGGILRLRRRNIPTREIATALAAKARAEAFEHAHFPSRRIKRFSVDEAWELYRPVCEREHRAYKVEKSRAKMLMRFFAKRQCMSLTVADVDTYRGARAKQPTVRGTTPSSTTVDCEVELLKRILKYAVTTDRLPANPIAKARLLKEPNVRTSWIDEEAFQRLLAAAAEHLQPVLVIAFDTGMRKREILDLKWSQVDMSAGAIRLAPQDTKGGEHRLVPLSGRALARLRERPRGLPNTYVFSTPSGKPHRDIDRRFNKAATAAALHGLWFHDLRRSFVTNARRSGIPESVIMKLTGHRTRTVFDRYNIVNEDDIWNAQKRLEETRGQSTGKVPDDRKKEGA